jgi:hypothetical protein
LNWAGSGLAAIWFGGVKVTMIVTAGPLAIGPLGMVRPPLKERSLGFDLANSDEMGSNTESYRPA